MQYLQLFYSAPKYQNKICDFLIRDRILMNTQNQLYSDKRDLDRILRFIFRGRIYIYIYEIFCRKEI